MPEFEDLKDPEDAAKTEAEGAGPGEAGGGRSGKIPKTALASGDDEWARRVISLATQRFSFAGPVKKFTAHAHFDELEQFLQSLECVEGIKCALLISHDLKVNVFRLFRENDLDPHAIAVWALAIFMNSEQVIKRMGHDAVAQIHCQTSQGSMVICDAGAYLLVCLY